MERKTKVDVGEWGGLKHKKVKHTEARQETFALKGLNRVRADRAHGFAQRGKTIGRKSARQWEKAIGQATLERRNSATQTGPLQKDESHIGHDPQWGIRG